MQGKIFNYELNGAAQASEDAREAHLGTKVHNFLNFFKKMSMINVVPNLIFLNDDV